MALWLDVNDYEFRTEDEKYEFIEDTFFDHMYHCPACSEAFVDAEEALHCCHEDCYEQDKSFVEEEMADFRLRQEKGD